MTEPATDVTAGPEELDRAPRGALRIVDPFLEMLLNSLGVEPSDTNMSLTLMTAGGMVTGNAVSLGTWERALVAAIKSANDQFGTTLEVLDRVVDELAADDAAERAQGTPHDHAPFIYMTEATLITPAGLHQMGLWSGRTDMVAGWSLGLMIF